MEPNLWLAITLAIIGSTNMNVGKAIQKWKVKVLAEGRRVLAPENRRDFLIWCAGVGLTASCTAIFSLALNNTDKPSLVSSMNGVGLIGLVLFAWLVLKERVGLQEMGGAGFVFAGTTLMGYFEKPLDLGGEVNLQGFLFIAPLLLLVFGPAAYASWRTHKLHGVTFGVLVGVLMGTAVILGKMALVAAGHSFWGQMANPYPYMALLAGLGALILTQLAFWRSTAMVVVPTINSVMILTPAVVEYFTFGRALKAPQFVGMAAIVAGVVLLTATEKQERLESKEGRDGQG